MWKRGCIIGCVVVLILGLTVDSSLAASHAETIKQLQEMLEAQQKQIDALKEQLNQLQSQQAEALKVVPKGVLKSGGDKASVQLYGQVNRGVLFADDGENTEVMFVDNDNSSTRIGLKAKADLTDDISAGTKIEVQFESNSTAAVSQADQSVGPNNFTERHLDLYLQSKRFGKLSLGQGDTASNGTSEVDLSGTGVVGYSGVTDMAGGLQFYDTDANALSGVAVGGVMSNMDGLSRRDRVRYDTPKFAGFQLSGSASEDEQSDIALRYAGQFGGFKIAAAAAYANRERAATEGQYNGSLSVLHDSGLNLTFAGGSRDLADSTRDAPTFWYGKLGYRFKSFDVGETALSADFGQFDDISQDNDEARSVGAFFVQKLSAIGTELYVGYRWYELDRLGSNFDDVTAVLSGARVKF